MPLWDRCVIASTHVHHASWTCISFWQQLLSSHKPINSCLFCCSVIVQQQHVSLLACTVLCLPATSSASACRTILVRIAVCVSSVLGKEAAYRHCSEDTVQGHAKPTASLRRSPSRFFHPKACHIKSLAASSSLEEMPTAGLPMTARSTSSDVSVDANKTEINSEELDAIMTLEREVWEHT